jgi:hypothetical protein
MADDCAKRLAIERWWRTGNKDADTLSDADLAYSLEADGIITDFVCEARGWLNELYAAREREERLRGRVRQVESHALHASARHERREKELEERTFELSASLRNAEAMYEESEKQRISQQSRVANLQFHLEECERDVTAAQEREAKLRDLATRAIIAVDRITDEECGSWCDPASCRWCVWRNDARGLGVIDAPAKEEP